MEIENVPCYGGPILNAWGLYLSMVYDQSGALIWSRNPVSRAGKRFISDGLPMLGAFQDVGFFALKAVKHFWHWRSSQWGHLNPVGPLF